MLFWEQPQRASFVQQEQGSYYRETEEGRKGDRKEDSLRD